MILKVVEQATEGINTTTDMVSTGMPFGATAMGIAKVVSGQEVRAGDVGFAAMELMPFGAVGKIAK